MSRKSARQMSRQESRAASAGAIVQGDAAADRGAVVEAFSFGDPEPVLDRRQMLDTVECPHNGRWYEPPISREGLARSFRVSPHHSSAIIFKRNQLLGGFVPTPYLSRSTFEKLVQDYLVFGDCYVVIVRSLAGTVLRLDYTPAKYTRRGVKPGTWFYVPGFQSETEFKPNSVIQLMQSDVNQEIYGVPEYISALQAALLNEAATLFRRKYYLNGAHAGYIMWASGDMDAGDVDKLKAAMKGSKGPGNFRSLFFHTPGGTTGKESSLKIIPIAEAGAKDEFIGIKMATQADIMAAHRVPPQLMGIVPTQGAAFGNPTEATTMFARNEIRPMRKAFLDLNAQLGVEVVVFEEEEDAAKAA